MKFSSEDLDRALLKNKKAIWTEEPELNPTEDQLDSLLSLFGESENASEPELRSAFGFVFRHFMKMAVKERFRESKGKLEKVSKPSTIVEQEMEQLRNACEALHKQIKDLDPVTKAWIDLCLKDSGLEQESGKRVRLRDLERRTSRLALDFSYAAKDAEGIASRGPKNTALKDMIAGLANCWEMYHGHPPTTDKGRGRQDDPFLELCQETAKIAHARLRAKGGELRNLQLSGLVAEVLKNRAS